METATRIKPTPSFLDCGIAALDRQDYESAIAILSWLSQQHPTTITAKLHAQMYLAMAYQANQNWRAAFDLAQRLSRCDDEQVRAWAFDVLPSLTKKSGIEGQINSSVGPCLEIYVSSMTSEPVRLPWINPPRSSQNSVKEHFTALIDEVLTRVQSAARRKRGSEFNRCGRGISLAS
jgi:hypothetical protein